MMLRPRAANAPSPRSSSRLRSRPGFAMFMALGALVIIAVLIAASSFVTLQESQAGQNQLVQSRAFASAEFGLNKIQADWDKTPNMAMANGTSYDMLYTTNNGKDTAKVRMTRLNDETFWLVSEGRSKVGDATNAARFAVKRVGAILRLRIPTIKAEGAITAGGNVVVKGGADIYGDNQDPPGWGSAASGDCNGIAGSNKAGVVVPAGSTVTTQGSSTVQGGGYPDGWRTDPLAADQNTYVRFGDETWNTLTSQANVTLQGDNTIGSNIYPTVTPPIVGTDCNKSNTLNWGEPWRVGADGHTIADVVAPCQNYFPIIYSNGNLHLNGSGHGQGILLVNGNVEINGHFEWYGLIIVTNDIVRGNGSATIYGGVMAKNEVKADESIISGTTTYNYSACALERAMRGSAQVVQAKERAWTELY
jgi:hypothetical protein